MKYLITYIPMRYSDLDEISHDIMRYPIKMKYLIVLDIVRYLIKIKISHSYRYHEIFHPDQNISWLLTSWDISSKYIMVIDQFNQSNKTVVNRFRLAHHRTALRDFFTFLWNSETSPIENLPTPVFSDEEILVWFENVILFSSTCII